MTHLDYTWEKREKMIYRDGVEDGEARGYERGIERGIEQGIEQGIAQGIARGAEDSRYETIRTMLAANIDVAIILKSGFTMEEIEKVRGRQ